MDWFEKLGSDDQDQEESNVEIVERRGRNRIVVPEETAARLAKLGSTASAPTAAETGETGRGSSGNGGVIGRR